MPCTLRHTFYTLRVPGRTDALRHLCHCTQVGEGLDTVPVALTAPTLAPSDSSRVRPTTLLDLDAVTEAAYLQWLARQVPPA